MSILFRGEAVIQSYTKELDESENLKNIGGVWYAFCTLFEYEIVDLTPPYSGVSPDDRRLYYLKGMQVVEGTIAVHTRYMKDSKGDAIYVSREDSGKGGDICNHKDFPNGCAMVFKDPMEEYVKYDDFTIVGIKK